MRASLFFSLLLIPSAAFSQALPDQVLALIAANQAWTLEQQRSICEIPAPPFSLISGLIARAM
jgi:hypothetical protein